MRDSPSTILIDSGGGWFDSKKPTAGLFTNPSYSLKYLNNKENSD